MDSLDDSPQRWMRRRIGSADIWLPCGVVPDGAASNVQYLPDSGLSVDSIDRLPELRSRLRTYSVEEFVSLVARVSWRRISDPDRLFRYMEQRDWPDRFAFQDYQMAFLTKVMLDEYDAPAFRSWSDNEDAQLDILHQVCRLVNGVLPDADRKVREQPPAEGKGALLIRRAYQQFSGFDDQTAMFARAFLIFLEMGRSAGDEHDVNLSDALRGVIGLDLEEWLGMAYLLTHLLANETLPSVFTVDLASGDSPYATAIRRVFPLLFSQLAVAPDGFRSLEDNPRVAPYSGYELYNFNPLLTHPIVLFDSMRYTIPSARLFMRRVSLGPFYDLFDVDGSRSWGQVQNAVGRAVELYVKRLVEDLPHHPPVLSGGAGPDRTSRCDWMVEEPDAIVLIECKRKSLKQASRTTGDRQILKQDIAQDQGICHAVVQLLETAAAVRAGEATGVSFSKPIIGLVVTQDWFYFANSPYVRGVIDELLLQGKVAPGQIDFQVCALPDLEDLCEYMAWSKRHLSTLLVEKMADPEWKTADISQWVRTKLWADAPESEREEATIPSHDYAYDSLLPEVVDRFRDTDRRP